MDKRRVRLKPNHLVIAIGLLVGLGTVFLGVLPEWTGFGDQHKHSAIQRPVFGGIPSALKMTFYIVIPLVIIYGGLMFAARTKNWQRGGPDRRATTKNNAERRVKDFRSGVYMQTLLRDPAAGVMHSMIYFSFLVLLAVTTVSEIDHQMPRSAKFLVGGTYEGFSLVGDLGGLILVLGILFAILRRYVQRPYRIRIKTKPEHALILGTFLTIGISGFLAEGFRIAAQGMPTFEKWSIIGWPIAHAVRNWDHVAGAHQVLWGVHVLSFIVFLAILPTTMLRHMFTSPLNLYLRDKERPKGAMKPMPNLTETELESFGASTIADFTWKQLLDTDACTMCGRCTAVCPAHGTGKSLDPREIVLKVGEVMAATGDPVVSPPIGTTVDITVKADSVFERITSEELWACTS
jgi:nitrate reductase gamma subunit/ferredoxin